MTIMTFLEGSFRRRRRPTGRHHRPTGPHRRPIGPHRRPTGLPPPRRARAKGSSLAPTKIALVAVMSVTVTMIAVTTVMNHRPRDAAEGRRRRRHPRHPRRHRHRIHPGHGMMMMIGHRIHPASPPCAPERYTMLAITSHSMYALRPCSNSTRIPDRNPMIGKGAAEILLSLRGKSKRWHLYVCC